MTSNPWKDNSWNHTCTSQFVKSYWQDAKVKERVKVGKTWDRTIRNEVKKLRHLGDKKVVPEPITHKERTMKSTEKKAALNLLEVVSKSLDLIERFDGICTKSAGAIQSLSERGLELRTKLLGAEYVREGERQAEDLIVAVGKKTCELLSPIAETMIKHAVRGLETSSP